MATSEYRLHGSRDMTILKRDHSETTVHGCDLGIGDMADEITHGIVLSSEGVEWFRAYLEDPLER